MQQPRGNLSSYSLPLLYKLISFHLLMWLPAKSNLWRLPLTSFHPKLKIVKNLLYGLQQKTAAVAFNQLHHDYAVICVFSVFKNVFFATSACYSRFMEEKGANFLLCKLNILLYRRLAKVLLIYFVSDCCGKQYKVEYISYFLMITNLWRKVQTIPSYSWCNTKHLYEIITLGEIYCTPLILCYQWHTMYWNTLLKILKLQLLSVFWIIHMCAPLLKVFRVLCNGHLACLFILHL